MNTEVASLWLRPSSIPIPLWPVCIYNYVYLFNLRHTSPVIEREISSGGAVGRFGNEPAQAPRLVFLGGGVIFESLVGAGVGMPRGNPGAGTNLHPMHRQMPVATHCGVVAEEGIALNKSGCRNQPAPDAQTNAGGHPLGGGSRRNSHRQERRLFVKRGGKRLPRYKILKIFTVIPPWEPVPFPFFTEN
jgi:hypothetical protein